MPSPRKPKAQPTWSDIKAKLSDFDRVGLMDLIGDLYSASSDNRTFLHTRFAVGADPLKPYKATISRWVCPDVFTRQTYSVAKAKKAISDYRKAVGAPQGLAELMTLHCEEASGFCADVRVDDEGFYDALVRMFEQTLKIVAKLEPAARTPFLERLKEVHDRSMDFGWGAADEICELWAESSLTQTLAHHERKPV
jgi:hypothetical protein